MAKSFLQPEKLDESQANSTKTARQTRRKFVENRFNENVNDWIKNKRAGTFVKQIAVQEIDKNKYFEWLKTGVLNYDERIILAAQDGGLLTNWLKKIFKLTTNDKCRFCQDSVETINHLLCNLLTINVCRVNHWREMNKALGN